MTPSRKTLLSLTAALFAAAAVYGCGTLAFQTQQAVAAGFGMVVGLALLGLACREFPKFRMGVINSFGYPGFGPVSMAALFGGLGGYWAFTIMMVGWGHG